MKEEDLRASKGRDARVTLALKRFRDLSTAAVPALILALQDPDLQLRRNAIVILADLSGGSSQERRTPVDIAEALPALIGSLHDPDFEVRALSAQAIGTMGPRGAVAVPDLIPLLSAEDDVSRNGSCIALGKIGAGSALPALRLAVNDSSARVRRCAQEAIRSIQGR